MTTWKIELDRALKQNGETWIDIESSTLTEEEENKDFDSSLGVKCGCSFTVWTKERVYFPAIYDGSEWVESVSRFPDNKVTKHIGYGG